LIVPRDVATFAGMNRIAATLFAFTLATSLAGAQIAVEVEFAPVERDGRYVEGPLDGQPAHQRDGTPNTDRAKKWARLGTAGSAVVEQPIGRSLDAAVLDEGALVQRPFAAFDTEVIYLESWQDGPGADHTLSAASYPSASEGLSVSALVHFSASNGIELLNGDGAGGGVIRTTGQSVGNGRQRITLRLDYGAKQWECWLAEDRSSGAPLGFRDNAAEPTAFTMLAASPERTEGLRIVRHLAGDANVDGIIDAADIITAEKFASYDAATYDVIGASQAGISGTRDADGRPIVTLDDIVAIRAMVLTPATP
jgi:hypothetical protein